MSLHPAVAAAILLATPVVHAGTNTWSAAGGTRPAGGFVVDTNQRNEVLSFWNAVYLMPQPEMGWMGSYTAPAGIPGSVSAAFSDAVRRRINFYRALAGMPADITFDAQAPPASPAVPAGTKKSECAQHAAFMNAIELVYDPAYPVSHDPDGTQVAWTTKAENGCRQGNLAVGYHGTDAVDIYMKELSGQVDAEGAGHRRMILYSRATDMATGDVPDGAIMLDHDLDARTPMLSFPVTRANCLYVTGAPRTNVLKAFTAWPSAGYFPAPLRTDYWSLGYPGADFTAAAVSVQGPSGPLPVRVLKRIRDNGTTISGDAALIWTVDGLPQPVTVDFPCTVNVTGIAGAGVPSFATYAVRFFNPNTLAAPVTLSGPATLTQAGANFAFAPVDGAESMRAEVLKTAAAVSTFAEGAEDATSGRITEKLSGAYTLRQAALAQNFGTANVQFAPRSGGKAFHLTHTGIMTDEMFTIGSEFVPSAASSLTFYECFRWLFSQNRLSLEVTDDGGLTWKEAYGRNGAYTYADGASYNSGLWDKISAGFLPLWNVRTVSLAPWAGKVVQLRFILRANGLGFIGTDQRFGCYVDDISVTGVQDILQKSEVEAAAGATAFQVLPADVPGGIVAGAAYLIRAQAQIGGRYMNFGPVLRLTGSAATGFQAWVEGQYPQLKGGAAGDDDSDGNSNFTEFVLGLNPLAADRDAMPQPVLKDGYLSLSFDPPSWVTGVTINAESSSDLSRWAPVADTGAGGTHSFRIPARSGLGYLRFRFATVQ